MRKAATVIISFVFIALLALRFIQLDADPPIMLAQYGQSALTDPYLYTWHARQATLFLPDQQIEYERFAPLKFTAVSASARVVFAVAGVSRVTANVASILLSLGGMLFWLLALRKFWSWRRVAIVGLLLLSNFILITYSRMPYLENGLIFFFGLTFFVYARWGERTSGQILTGLAIAGAALCGKLFGVLLFVPVVVTQVYFLRSRSLRPIGLTILGGLLGFAAYLLIFLGGDFALWWQYQSDNTALLSVSKYIFNPLGPLGMFLSFGAEGGLRLFGIGTICIASIGSIFWFVSRDLRQLTRDDLPIIFCLIWLATTLIVFLSFEFRPLRYLIVSVIPAVTLGIPLLESWGDRRPLVLRPLWLVLPSVFLVMLYLTNQIISYGADLAHMVIGFRVVLPYCLATAGVVTAALWWIRRRKTPVIPIPVGRILIVILVGLYGVTNGRDIYTALFSPRYDLKTLNREVAEIIDSTAIVTGSYAPALTIDNKLDGIFNYLGTVRHDPAFFDKFNPTHVLSNQGDLREMLEDYSALAQATVIAEPILWSYHLQMLSLPRPGFNPSLFEQAELAYRAQHYDTARILLDRFDRLYPRNRLSAASRVNLYIDLYRGSDSAISLVNRLVREYSDDFYMLAFAAVAYQNANLPNQSRECLARCNQLNPYARPRL